MLRLLFVLNFFFASLMMADDLNISDTNQTQQKEVYQQKVIYLNYEEVPSRVIKGEIFPVTLKTLCVIPDIKDINYTFSNQKDIEILNDSLPKREIRGKFFYDTFYFRAIGTDVKLPDITASIEESYGRSYLPTTLRGKKIETIALNPKENYSNIIAKDLEVIKYKTTSYDQTQNIIVFSIEAKGTFLEDFHLNNIQKQGIESVSDSIESSKMIYYAIIDKNIENFNFSYFNIDKNEYIQINIPIIVEDDSVTTQSDLKPKDQSKQNIKILIALGIIAFGVVMLLWRKKYIYIIFIIIPAIYVIYIMMPDEKICIKKGANIKILPLENGTVFEVLQTDLKLNKIGKSNHFIKVQLHNNKIGWVSDEDICSN